MCCEMEGGIEAVKESCCGPEETVSGAGSWKEEAGLSERVLVGGSVGKDKTSGEDISK